MLRLTFRVAWTILLAAVIAAGFLYLLPGSLSLAY
jgi:hypothetical protein